MDESTHDLTDTSSSVMGVVSTMAEGRALEQSNSNVDCLYCRRICGHDHHSQSSLRVSQDGKGDIGVRLTRFNIGTSPLPPSAAISQRLLEAANAAGGNLQKASSGVQTLLSDAARRIGINSASSSTSNSIFASNMDVSSILKTLHLPDGEALARSLGVKRDHTNELLSTLERYQSRAQAWKEGNVSVLGWTGAVIGSTSAFTLMFGIVGLFGLFTPKKQLSPSKPKSSFK
jgi:hypothetical protein